MYHAILQRFTYSPSKLYKPIQTKNYIKNGLFPFDFLAFSKVFMYLCLHITYLR